jgi:hypothetical protein
LETKPEVTEEYTTPMTQNPFSNIKETHNESTNIQQDNRNNESTLVDINIINSINSLQVKDLEIRNKPTKNKSNNKCRDKIKKSIDTKKTDKRKSKQQQVRIVTTNVHGFQIEKTRKLNHILN